ncbi:ABC transporter ATP-binding protein [Mesorhizobium sp. 8]|uniref:ABC transporter ATP-binding protein n=1 Tax=Mesorhizobium sp. 8 TaxID=2584466 RepID=UPI0011249814|nr:ABC transporter ATP-binding protein [Mesorhizobium sp. 8]QDC00695.1 ABC transporter ATP-binding protein [Mesorhizobium sp. 8]
MHNGLKVENLRKIYFNSDQAAGGIHAADFDLPQGTFFTLLGPSGCGKTTTLRCIAGLEQPDAGRIEVGGEVFHDAARGISVPLNRRGFGMVFQSYAIWPHMSVFENVSFPLRVARDRTYSREEIRTLSQKALATVGLDQFADRPATRLSGGQQQRVALARAIVREPKLLLLDEPLSNLDAALRESMRHELKRLQRQIGVTTVYVTHDQAEAFEMSDRIAVINKGEVVQVGDPETIYFRPRNSFVAAFVGNTNLLKGTVEGAGSAGGTLSVRLAGGQAVECRAPREGRVAAGDTISISVRPEAVNLVTGEPVPTGKVNCVEAEVANATFAGNMRRYEITAPSVSLVATPSPRVRLEIGQRVIARFAVEDAIALPDSP